MEHNLNGGSLNIRDAVTHSIEASIAWSKHCITTPFGETRDLREEAEVEAAKAILKLAYFIGGKQLEDSLKEFLHVREVKTKYDEEV